MDSIVMPCFSCGGTLLLQAVEPVFDYTGGFKYFLEIFVCQDCGAEFCFRKIFSEHYQP